MERRGGKSRERMAGEGEEVFLGHELQARASSVVTVVRYIGLGILVLSNLVLSRCRGKVRESGVCEQFAHVGQFAICIFVIVFIVIVIIIIVVIVRVRLSILRLSIL